jgi:hypothetical protein
MGWTKARGLERRREKRKGHARALLWILEGV